MCICILAVATIVVDDDDDDKWTEFYIFFVFFFFFFISSWHRPHIHRHHSWHAIVMSSSCHHQRQHHHTIRAIVRHLRTYATVYVSLCYSCVSLCACLCVCFTFGLWMYARPCISPIRNVSLGAIFSTWIALHSNDMAVPAGRPLQRECIAPPLPWFKQTFWRCDDHSVFIFVFYWADGSLQRVVCRRDEHFWHYFRPCRLHRAQCHRMLCALTSSGEMNFYALWDE